MQTYCLLSCANLPIKKRWIATRNDEYSNSKWWIELWFICYSERNCSSLRFKSLWICLWRDSVKRALHKMLQRKKKEPFPFIDMRRCRNWRSSRRYRYKLFCSCKMPFDDQDEGFPEKYRKLVECKGCKNWFHVSCEMIPNDVLTERRSSWRCSKCVQQWKCIK